ncbi:hypothetical protein BO70DRAFT_366019 [Aspergillus heteromorphus CBS 117.55]|uniref:F-box domain-containing protein n=1 Tax=Aspergillus heteromorphus CBS 117.55 TaxID=1448321 RepID=A0A317V3P6_9EURO|nr:uncharacterized protein BO70DRAFT_366019 [Aspergillus heteromorphus CBS 117.55]PWY68646.1 hypothetical protein BO70DRAFT_366019 [Aspergillus heteromorphus CBS 117.55]
MSAIQKIGDSTYIFLDIKDNTLDDIDKASCSNKRLNNYHPPRYGLRILDRLPLEIIQMVLMRLDIRSLTDFRQVNRKARLVTDSIPQYRQILTHAPALFRRCLNIESARFFSCQELYNQLCTAECDSCGDFGGYLYLITCRRVCFLCFTEKVDYLPLLRKDLTIHFGLHSKNLTGLPCMRSFPGRYSPRGIKCQRRQILFDYSSARQAGVAVHGSIESMEKYALQMASKRSNKNNSDLPYGRTGEIYVRRSRSECPVDGKCSNPRRFMSIISAPYLGEQLATAEWGVHCVACKPHHYGRPLHWRRKYTIKGFQGHVRECGEIISGRHVCNQAEMR